MDNCNKCKPKNCGCKDAHVCGCDIKLDLLCAFYSGQDLEPLGITQGMDGNTVIEIINDFLQQIELDPTTIANVGNGIELYKGLSPEYKHEIKTLVQGEGITITEQNDTIVISNTSPGGVLEREVTSAVNEGNITAGQVLPKGMTFTKFVEEFLLKTFYPDLLPPFATLNIDKSDREVGSSYSFTATISLDRGAIKGSTVNGVWQPSVVQNPRSGVATNYNIAGTNLGLTNTKTLTSTEYGLTKLGTNSFSGFVDYADSNIQPIDSVGQPYDSPLLQGQVTDSNSFTGKYKMFYGPAPVGLPLDRASFDGVLDSELVSGPVIFDFSTGTTERTFLIAIPANRSFRPNEGVRNTSALNQLITPSFELQNVTQLADPSGTMHNYKIYRMVNDKSFDTNQIFRVNLI